jgi:hypothetical protein
MGFKGTAIFIIIYSHRLTAIITGRGAMVPWFSIYDGLAWFFIYDSPWWCGVYPVFIGYLGLGDAHRCRQC